MGSASENGVPRMSAALKRNKRCRQSAARVLWEDPCVLEEAQKWSLQGTLESTGSVVLSTIEGARRCMALHCVQSVHRRARVTK
jgi:hypothetical protein